MGDGIGMRLTMFLGGLGEMMKGVGSDWCKYLFDGMIARTTRMIGQFDQRCGKSRGAGGSFACLA
jgi:hypothetical protein